MHMNLRAGVQALLVLAAMLLPPMLASAQTPEATPVGSGSEWRIADINRLVTDGQLVAISPDGQWIAGVSPSRQFCIWDVATLTPTCVDAELPIRPETIAWAPDSTAVAFALDAVRQGHESDIYVYEMADRTLTNLTDDGVEGSLLNTPSGTPLDDVPAWSPDGSQIAFARSERGEDAGSTTIMRIDRAGGAPEVVYRLPVEEPLVVWLPIAWLPDGDLVFSQISANLHDDRNGIWRVPAAGGDATLVLPGSDLADVPGPEIASVDRDRGVAIVFSRFLLGRFGAQADQPLFWIVDMASGEHRELPALEGTDSPVQTRIFGADFAPDGMSVIAWSTAAPSGYALVMIDMSTGAVTNLDLPEQQEPIPPLQPQWVAGNEVMLTSPSGAWLLTLEHDGS